MKEIKIPKYQITDLKLTEQVTQYIQNLTTYFKNNITKLIYPEAILFQDKSMTNVTNVKNYPDSTFNINQVSYYILSNIKESRKLLKNNLQQFKNKIITNNLMNTENVKNNLLLILLWEKKFTSYGFNSEQIVQIATSRNGEKKLQLINANYSKFVDMQYNAKHLVKICSLSHGYDLLMYILNNDQWLKKLYSTNEQVIKFLELHRQNLTNKVNQMLIYNHSLKINIHVDDVVAISQGMLTKYKQFSAMKNKVNSADYIKDITVVDYELGISRLKKRQL